MSIFIERLKEYMDDAHLSGVSLAKAIGCSRVTISGLMNGAHAPSTKLLIKIVEYFNCSADYLLGLTDYPKRENFDSVKPFGQRLKLCLSLAGKTEYRLQTDLHISRSLTYRWLNDMAIPSIESLKNLAKYFGCSVDYLLGRES